MKRYLAISRASLSTVIVHRGAFILLMLGGVVQCVALLAVWRSLLADSAGGTLGGYTWDQMRGYLLVTFMTGMFVSSFTDVQLGARILDGTVATDLLRPVDFQLARFAESIGYLGGEVAVVLLSTVAMVIGFGGVGGLAGTQALLFAISVALVVPLKFGLAYLFGTLCFWTESYQGVGLARAAVASVLSGAMVPIDLYPGWLRTLCELSPFTGMAATQARLYLEQVTGPAAVRLVALQLVWVLVLIVAGRLAWRPAVHRLSVHGG
jgi:ABC-2 type transport system permease protein